VSICDAGYTGFGLTTDDFLNRVVTAVRARYGATLGGDFGTGLGDMAGVTWFGPRMTWTSDSRNAAWIDRWRRLDAEVGTRLGMAGLGDDFWGSLSSGPLGPSVVVTVQWSAQQSTVVSTDQLGGGRPAGRSSDIGAIER
jgi:hypothetical protein